MRLVLRENATEVWGERAEFEGLRGLIDDALEHGGGSWVLRTETDEKTLRLILEED